MTPITWILLAAMALSIVLAQVNLRVASPGIAIVNRWLRWFIFSVGAAYVCLEFRIIDRPFPRLAAAFALAWFLAETMYNWLTIRALSVSPRPLFPRYRVNDSGEEWPMLPRMLRVRDWLRSQGYRQVQALRAELGGDVPDMRVSVYQDAAALLRIHVMFLPAGNGSISVCYSLATRTADGTRHVTDNLYVPFGGFYPGNWIVDRRPWCRSLQGLLRRHLKGIEAGGSLPEAWTVEPATDLNSQQSELDRLNTELGFLNPQNERENLGKITSQGCYRVWKEIWMLDYFGLPGRQG